MYTDAKRSFNYLHFRGTEIKKIDIKTPTSSLLSPASSHFFAVLFRFSAFLPVIESFAPSLANSTAVDAPIPALAPINARSYPREYHVQ